MNNIHKYIDDIVISDEQLDNIIHQLLVIILLELSVLKFLLISN